MEIPGQRENCCARCGEDLFAPLVDGNAEASFCRACRLVPPPFARAVSYGVYEGRMRSAIHALKYEGVEAASRRLGQLLAVAIARLAGELPGPVLVVPVPLHAGRMKQRGFNQARKLAAEALRALRHSHPEWKLELAARALVRQRSTQSQAGLSPRQRRQNLSGAFFVPDFRSVLGRTVLLVDDIFTTGATARACAKALVEAGVASVSIATLARAQRRVPLPFKDEMDYKAYTRLAISEAELRSPGTTVH